MDEILALLGSLGEGGSAFSGGGSGGDLAPQVSPYTAGTPAADPGAWISNMAGVNPYPSNVGGGAEPYYDAAGLPGQMTTGNQAGQQATALQTGNAGQAVQQAQPTSQATNYGTPPKTGAGAIPGFGSC